MSTTVTLGDRLKTIFTAICSNAAVYEIYMPFDSKTKTYRANNPTVVFRIEEMTEEPAGSGLYRIAVRVDILGKAEYTREAGMTITDVLAEQQNDANWSISLAPGTPAYREQWDVDLNINWATVMLKGIAIRQ